MSVDVFSSMCTFIRMQCTCVQDYGEVRRQMLFISLPCFWRYGLSPTRCGTVTMKLMNLPVSASLVLGL